METLIKNNLGQWTLQKSQVKEDIVECSGQDCNKKILRSNAVPLANFAINKRTGAQVSLTPKKFLCDDCFKKQYESKKD